MSRERFIATSVIAAIIVDISRLAAYGVAFYSEHFGIIRNEMWKLVALATLSAFVGAYFGKRMIKKITIDIIQKIVGIMLITLGMALAVGLV